MEQHFSDYKMRIGFDIPDKCRPVLDTALSEKDLLLCLRGDEIHIYYRGGKILEVEKYERSKNDCALSFDKKYLGKDAEKPYWMEKQNIIAKPKDFFQLAKKAMDDWFKNYPKEERDDQHQIALRSSVDDENGLSVIDIEYAVSFYSHAYNKKYIDENAPNGKKYKRYPNPRFDIVAVDRNGQLYVLELKTGVDSLDNLEKHYRDFQAMIGSLEQGDDKTNALPRWKFFAQEIAEMANVLNKEQYRTKPIPAVNTELPPKFGFVFTSNGDTEITAQVNEFKRVLKSQSLGSIPTIYPPNYKLTISE